MPKYKIENHLSGLTFYKNRKSINDIPAILRQHSTISIVERGGNQFALGGMKQYYRKRKPVCIVDSRPSVMAIKMGLSI
jgi:hypothetical protein